MKRTLLVTAACVLSFGMTLGGLSTADAASKATIRTYTEHATISFKGIGDGVKGYQSFGTDSESVILAPHLALKGSTGNYILWNGHLSQSSGQFYIVGKRSFTKTGSRPWVVKSLTAAGLAHYAYELNPYVSVSKFDRLPGIRRLSATRYILTGSPSRLMPFLSYEYGLTTKSFENTRIKSITVALLLDSSGRPAEFAISGRSSAYVFAVIETFSNYNQPLTITAP